MDSAERFWGGSAEKIDKWAVVVTTGAPLAMPCCKNMSEIFSLANSCKEEGVFADEKPSGVAGEIKLSKLVIIGH